MPEVIFSHVTQANPLVINTGANKIQWGYGLNTQTTPTYGGEVVQILSAYIDDLTIEGDLRNYAKMEKLYEWFLVYMQSATQSGNFVDSPVIMKYPERGWRMAIRPLALPGFRLGTEVVAPSWQLTANVVEADTEMVALTTEQAIKHGFDFNRLHAGIGYDQDNPFTDPFSKKSTYNPEESLGEVSDFYQNLIPSYLKGDFDSLFQGFTGGQVSGPTKKKKKGDEEDATEVAEVGVDSVVDGILNFATPGKSDK